MARINPSHQPDLFLQHGKGLAHRATALQLLTTAEYHVITALARRAFGDRKQWLVEAVTKNRKDAQRTLLVYRIILPFAGGDATAV